MLYYMLYYTLYYKPAPILLSPHYKPVHHPTLATTPADSQRASQFAECIATKNTPLVSPMRHVSLQLVSPMRHASLLVSPMRHASLLVSPIRHVSLLLVSQMRPMRHGTQPVARVADAADVARQPACVADPADAAPHVSLLLVSPMRPMRKRIILLVPTRERLRQGHRGSL